MNSKACFSLFSVKTHFFLIAAAVVVELVIKADEMSRWTTQSITQPGVVVVMIVAAQL